MDVQGKVERLSFSKGFPTDYTLADRDGNVIYKIKTHQPFFSEHTTTIWKLSTQGAPFS